MDDNHPVANSPDSALRWYQFQLKHAIFALIAGSLILAWFFSPFQSVPRKTHRELDLAIFGGGYFQLTDYWSGETFYTRNGNLSINSEGALCVGRSSDKWILEPPISIPTDALEVEISHDGIVNVTQAGSVSPTQAGQIQIADFTNPDGLREVVPGIFRETEESGSAIVGNPAQTGLGYIQQGWLERSDARFQFTGYTLALLLGCVIIFWILLEIRRLHRKLDRVIMHNATYPNANQKPSEIATVEPHISPSQRPGRMEKAPPVFVDG